MVNQILDCHLKSVMAGGKSYIKDTNNFLEKLKKLEKVASHIILVTAEVVQRFSFLRKSPAHLFMEKVESEFLPLEEYKQWIWLKILFTMLLDLNLA